MTILLLGGTAEARLIAQTFAAESIPVVTSLAGDVAHPVLPPGEVRVGGFGGVAGLTAYLRDNHISAVVDATHPFAEQMTLHAARATLKAQVPMLRFSRPGWAAHPQARTWRWVDSLIEAKHAAADAGSRTFLSTGRQTLSVFADWIDRYVLVRVVDPPDFDVPPTWEVLFARGPFTDTGEHDLLSSRSIDVLVTKDSGGHQTVAKLDAAHRLGIAVVVVRRPPTPGGIPVVTTVPDAVEWSRSFQH